MTELIERIPLRTVRWLKSLSFEVYCEHYEAKFIRDNKPDKKRQSKKDLKDKYNYLQLFCDNNIKSGGVMQRIYKYSLHTPTELGGRLFCGGSLQGISGMYRSLLLNGITTDIDMKNAHPVILLYICKKHNITPRSELEYYVNHRDEILKQWSSRDAGKTAYLENTNNDKHSGAIAGETPEANAALRMYTNENKKIQKALVNLPEYVTLTNSIPEDKIWNRNGSAMNRILCYYENIILGHSDHILNIRNIESCVKMFDGQEAYGDYYQDRGLLTDIENYVESKMNGLKMKWEYKHHDTIHSVPDEFDEEDILVEKEGVLNDRETHNPQPLGI